MSVFPIQREKLQNPAVWLATMELGHSHALIGTLGLAEAAVCAFGDALGPAQAQHTPLVQNLVVRPVNRRDRRSQIALRIWGRPRRHR